MATKLSFQGRISKVRNHLRRSMVFPAEIPSPSPAPRTGQERAQNLSGSQDHPKPNGNGGPGPQTLSNGCVDSVVFGSVRSRRPDQRARRPDQRANLKYKRRSKHKSRALGCLIMLTGNVPNPDTTQSPQTLALKEWWEIGNRRRSVARRPVRGHACFYKTTRLVEL